MISLLTPDERAGYLDAVARKAAPSFDFFLFSLLAGALLGIGYLVDSPYLLVLGAMTAPLMAPLVGVSLGTILGSTQYFGRSLGGMAIASLLVLFSSALAGLLGRLWLPLEMIQAHLHSQLAWPPFLVIGIAAVLTSSTLVKEDWQTSVSSVALAYGLFTPLSAAGLGLGSGVPHLWPDGLVLFALYLAWATLLGAATLAIMGFRPLSLFGYSIGGAIALVMVLLALAVGGAGMVVGGQVALPTETFTPTSTRTLTPTASHTPEPPTATPTASRTATASTTPTITLTPSPTPIQALVIVGEGFNGAFLRDAPNGRIIASLFNGSIVQILGETQLDESNRLWLRVLSLETDDVGWILQSLLVTATPPTTDTPPAAEGTATPTP
ncbi:MAG: SH3 domain-containing protein [Chloroflexi bacterium]|nr:SH3 domain-containing protein [Chloroflexota bacterium]